MKLLNQTEDSTGRQHWPPPLAPAAATPAPAAAALTPAPAAAVLATFFFEFLVFMGLAGF
jgi:hypothetical protein